MRTAEEVYPPMQITKKKQSMPTVPNAPITIGVATFETFLQMLFTNEPVKTIANFKQRIQSVLTHKQSDTFHF